MATESEKRVKGLIDAASISAEKIETQGAPPNIALRKERIVPMRAIRTRQSLIGNMPFVEVLRNSNFVAPNVDPKPTPTEYALEQNYPNPFNPSTTIAYSLPTESFVTLRVYDVLGRLVATLYEGTQQTGRFVMAWDGESSYGTKVASGVYFYRFEATPNNGTAGFVGSKKMVLAR